MMATSLRRDTTTGLARYLPSAAVRPAKSLQVSIAGWDLTTEDVIVGSYPKSGTTWLRFLLVDALSGGPEPEFDTINAVSPGLGSHRAAPVFDGIGGRLIQTHDQFQRFPFAKPRSVIVVRDGRDVVISLLHYLQRRGQFDGTLSELIPHFLAGDVFNFGSWTTHVTRWHRAAQRSPDRIRIVRYEDLLASGEVELRRVLEWLGVAATADAVESIWVRNSATAMGAKESVAPTDSFRFAKKSDIPFVRAGKSGQWQEHFSESDLKTFQNAGGAALQLLNYESS